MIFLFTDNFRPPRELDVIPLICFCYSFPNGAFRIVRSPCAIRDNNVVMPNDALLWVHHRVRTCFENKRLSFSCLNSWRAIDGIRH